MIRLYASTFGEPTKWISKAVSIEVGAALRTIQREPNTLYDDTGDSISSDNSYWGELTGLYWIWKNVSFEEDDIFGFCHYNKCLEPSGIEKAFHEHADSPFWIVREPEAIVPHDYLEDIQILRDVLKIEDISYLEAWDALYDETGASVGGKKNCYCMQMFYTDKQSFLDYCDFLFRVLFQVREQIGDCDRPAYHKRYCAFLGERLLSVYLLRNQCEIATREVRYNENIFFRFARKIRKSFTGGFGFFGLRKWLGKRMQKSYQSSYTKEKDEERSEHKV